MPYRHVCLFICRGGWWNCCCWLDGIVFAPGWHFGSMYEVKDIKKMGREGIKKDGCGVFVLLWTNLCVRVSLSLCEPSFQWQEGHNAPGPFPANQVSSAACSYKGTELILAQIETTVLYFYPGNIGVRPPPLTKLIKHQHEAWSCSVRLYIHTCSPTVCLLTHAFL